MIKCWKLSIYWNIRKITVIHCKKLIDSGILILNKYSLGSALNTSTVCFFWSREFRSTWSSRTTLHQKRWRKHWNLIFLLDGTSFFFSLLLKFEGNPFKTNNIKSLLLRPTKIGTEKMHLLDLLCSCSNYLAYFHEFLIYHR